MKKQIQNLILLLFICLCSHVANSQEKLEVTGAIIINNAEATIPVLGTIRFNSAPNDFEGWNQHQWLSQTRMSEPGGGVSDTNGNSHTTKKSELRLIDGISIKPK